jgi:hypothetical protein
MKEDFFPEVENENPKMINLKNDVLDVVVVRIIYLTQPYILILKINIIRYLLKELL